MVDIKAEFGVGFGGPAFSAHGQWARDERLTDSAHNIFVERVCSSLLGREAFAPCDLTRITKDSLLYSETVSALLAESGQLDRLLELFHAPVSASVLEIIICPRR